MQARTVAAIRHVHFEDLGSYAPAFAQHGYTIRYFDVGGAQLTELASTNPHILVVLGGPIGAYEDDKYPFLIQELRILESRLAARLPTLGICLGAQLMARALGAKVYPGAGKEIGWSPLDLTDAGRSSPLAVLADGAAVLHWHGDTFDLPPGASLLASTALTRNQAFSAGPHALALQFHAECEAAGIERWLIGHACELSAAGIDPAQLRLETAHHAPRLTVAACAIIAAWLAEAEQLPSLAAEIS